MLRLYNTMTRKVAEFQPIDDRKVGLYTCGPTVYNYAHIGNLRTYVFEDILKRVLRASGYQVRHVMNVTDVGHLTSDADAGDDKMELGAAREGKTVWQIADEYWRAFRDDMARLNLIEPDVWCKATDHIGEQIALIQKLQDKGFTYIIADGVYFDTSKLADYGKLARLDLAGLQAGARIELAAGKRNITDFALWKFSPADKQRLMEWDSPWGKGFPGWHIECSAMAMKYLGERVDIHCGGIDHVPVHHTNEIAQTESATGQPWVNWWMHGEFLTMVKEEGGQAKMAKSAGSFVRLDTLVEKGFEPLAYRYFCLNSHYRQQLAFSWEGLQGASNAFGLLRARAIELRQAGGAGEAIQSHIKAFMEAVEEDLNLPRALAALWGALEDTTSPKADVFATALEMDRILGFDLGTIQLPQKVIDEIEKDIAPAQKEKAATSDLIEKRNTARKEKNFADADKIRNLLEIIGVTIKDTPQGTTWVSVADARAVLRQSVERTAIMLQVRDVQSKSIEELFTNISERDRIANDLLKAYLEAWMNWWSFHIRIEKQGRSDALNEAETEELIRKIVSKEESRAALVSHLQRIES